MRDKASIYFFFAAIMGVALILLAPKNEQQSLTGGKPLPKAKKADTRTTGSDSLSQKVTIEKVLSTEERHRLLVERTKDQMIEDGSFIVKKGVTHDLLELQIKDGAEFHAMNVFLPETSIRDCTKKTGTTCLYLKNGAQVEVTRKLRGLIPAPYFFKDQSGALTPTPQQSAVPVTLTTDILPTDQAGTDLRSEPAEPQPEKKRSRY